MFGYNAQLHAQILAAIGRVEADTKRIDTNTKSTSIGVGILLELIKDSTRVQTEMLAVQKEIAESTRQTAQALLTIKERLFRIPKPGPLSWVVTEEIGSMLAFKITLPDWSGAAPDVVFGELSVSVAGAEPVVQSVAPGTVEVEGFSGNDNDVVKVAFVYVDDATPVPNRSAASEKEFTLTDTIAPAQPGEVGLVVTGEVL